MDIQGLPLRMVPVGWVHLVFWCFGVLIRPLTLSLLRGICWTPVVFQGHVGYVGVCWPSPSSVLVEWWPGAPFMESIICILVIYSEAMLMHLHNLHGIE